MPNRNVEGNYRYAYQGQEKDLETGMEAFELRLWDSRVGRWLTTDTYRQFASPYLGMGNNPISGVDLDGGYVYIIGKDGTIVRAIATSMLTQLGEETFSKFLNSESEHLIIMNTSNDRGDGTTVGPLRVGEQTTLTKANLEGLLKKQRQIKATPDGASFIGRGVAESFLGVTLQPGDNYLIKIDVEKALKRPNGWQWLVETTFHEPALHANDNPISAQKEHIDGSGNRFGNFIGGRRRKPGTVIDVFLKQLENLPQAPLPDLRFLDGTNQLFNNITPENCRCVNPRYF